MDLNIFLNDFVECVNALGGDTSYFAHKTEIIQTEERSEKYRDFNVKVLHGEQVIASRGYRLREDLFQKDIILFNNVPGDDYESSEIRRIKQDLLRKIFEDILVCGILRLKEFNDNLNSTL